MGQTYIQLPKTAVDRNRLWLWDFMTTPGKMGHVVPYLKATGKPNRVIGYIYNIHLHTHRYIYIYIYKTYIGSLSLSLFLTGGQTQLRALWNMNGQL